MKSVFTIATYSHYWQAKLLMESLKRYESDARFIIVLVENKQKLELHEDYEHIWLNDILPNAEKLSHRYSAAEMCFITKPAAFSHLISEGKSHEIYYFDSDIRLYHNLSPFSKALEEANILLTPHHLFPFEQLSQPKEFDNMRTGVFNMGFCAMRPTLESERLCKWWKVNTENFGEEQFDLGLSADQQWMSLAPTLFNGVVVFKHPGANVAFWNLHERNLREEENLIYVNGQPLLFIHFSNFQIEPEIRLAPNHLYQREDLLENETIQKLSQQYASEIKEAQKNRTALPVLNPIVKPAKKRVKKNVKSFGVVKLTALVLIHSLPSQMKIWIYKFGLFLVRNIKFK